jgi:hypothetical protein
MRVYVLTSCYDEDTEIVSIYKNEEAAKAKLKELESLGCSLTKYYIDDYDLIE